MIENDLKIYTITIDLKTKLLPTPSDDFKNALFFAILHCYCHIFFIAGRAAESIDVPSRKAEKGKSQTEIFEVFNFSVVETLGKLKPK